MLFKPLCTHDLGNISKRRCYLTIGWNQLVTPQKDMRTYQKFNKYLKNNIRWLVKGEPSNTLKELLDSIEESKNWVVVRSSSFRKVLNYTHNQESFYMKQYTVKNNLEAIKSLVSISKVQREWNKGNLLLKNNLLTAEPVAVGEKRCFGC